MESKPYTEISSFYFSLEEIIIQAQKVENKFDKYSREWAQVASFRTKCKETQTVLANYCRRELKDESKNLF